jgi:hypothetical protein
MTARINPDPIALADMVSRGMTALQIGAYFNTSDTTARKWLKAYGLRATGTGSRAPKGEQFRREVEFLARQSVGPYGIAVQLGVTFPAVLRCMERHQIKPATRQAISYVKPRRANDPFGLCA